MCILDIRHKFAYKSYLLSCTTEQCKSFLIFSIPFDFLLNTTPMRVTSVSCYGKQLRYRSLSCKSVGITSLFVRVTLKHQVYKTSEFYCTEGGCPKDFYFAKEGGNVCYFISSSTESYSWYAAKSACETMNASLAELRTQEEFDNVENMLLSYGMNEF